MQRMGSSQSRRTFRAIQPLLMLALVVLLAACAQVRLPGAAPEVEFSAEPQAITAGESAVLNWLVTGEVDSVVLQPFGDAVDAEGTRTVTPAETTTYAVVATNRRGRNEAEVTVSVRQPDDPPLIARFQADPTEISTGESSVLSWDVAGADDITISQGIGTVAGNTGNRTVSPADTTEYVLTASNAYGTVSATASVTVRGSGDDSGRPLITSFSADPEGIERGDVSTLSWNVSGADSITISPTVGTVSATGTAEVSPTTTTSYTLRATNSAGTSSRTVTVYVREDPAGAPLIGRFNANPARITPGQTSTLSWVIVGADTVTIDQGIGDVAPNSSTSVAPDATTTYTLTASNAAGTSTRSVTVEVSSDPAPVQPAVAAFLADPAGGTAPFDTTFHWLILDPSDLVESISIDFGDLTPEITPTELASSADHNYATAGAYTAELTALLSDGSVIKRSTTVSVSGSGSGQPPTIDEFKADPAAGTAPLTVSFEWGITADLGTICVLDLGDGSAEHTVFDCDDGSFSHQYRQPGVYTPSLVIQDEDNRTARESITVTVLPAADADSPVISAFTASPDSGDMPLEVTFDWTAESPAGLPVNTWLFYGDGSVPTEGAASGSDNHTYADAGQYQAVLVAADSAGGYDVKLVTITVIDPASITTAVVRTGSTLIELDADERGLLAPLLAGLLGKNADLTVLSNDALLNTQVDLLDLLEVLSLNLGATGPEIVLLDEVDLADVLGALLDVVSGTAAALPLQDLLDELPAEDLPIELGDLINIDPEDLLSLRNIELSVLDLVALFLELFNAQNVVGAPEPVEIGLSGVGGLLPLLGLDGVIDGLGAGALARIHLQIVEPPVITVARVDRLGSTDGSTSFRSAGIRLAVELNGLGLSLDSLDEGSGLVSGLLGLVAGLLDALALLDLNLDLTVTDLDLFAEVGGFEGEVTAINETDGSVTIASLGTLAHLHLGSVDPVVFFDRNRTTPVTADFGTIATVDLGIAATLVGLPLASVDVTADVLARADSSRTVGANTITFTGPYPKTQTVPSASLGTLITDLLADLEVELDAQVDIGGALGGLLPVNTLLNELLGVVTSLVNDVLGITNGSVGANLPLDDLLSGLLDNGIFRVLGLEFNENDVTVLNVLLP